MHACAEDNIYVLDINLKSTMTCDIEHPVYGGKLGHRCAMKHIEIRVSDSSKAIQRYVHLELYHLVAMLEHKGPNSVQLVSS